MNKFFLGGVSALAFLALGTAAQAQSLSDAVGGGLIGLQGTFANGNWVNESLNTGIINSSVVLSGLGTSDTLTAVDLGGISITAEAAAALALALGVDIADLADLDLAAALAIAAELGIDLDFGGAVVDAQLGGNIASLSEISTLAAGAVNTGDIASVGTTVSGAASVTAFDQTIGAVSAAGTSASSAANTTNTAAAAAASQVRFEAGETTTAASVVAGEFSASGPLVDVYATNRAFNNAGINASVTALANDVDLNGISTLAAGAVNTGTISMGFNGSGLANIR